jgi:ATP-dependent Clp protease ATP-binding subunit ClpA
MLTVYLAGATFPGEFEERLRGVLAELTAASAIFWAFVCGKTHVITMLL